MKKILLLPIFFSFALELQASVDPEIHKMCIQAKDYLGCVKAMKGDSNSNQENKITVDLDKVRNTGNSCPDGFAYKGAGYCQEIVCLKGGKHDPRLGGKGNTCLGRPIIGRYTMHFGNQTIRATTDERCPLVEPEIGRSNSCSNGLSEDELKKGIRNYKHPAAGQELIGLGIYATFSESGAKVCNIDSFSPAAKNGLKVGDLITHINGDEMDEDFLTQNMDKKLAFLTWKLSDMKKAAKQKRLMFGWNQVRTPQSKDVVLYPFKNGAAKSGIMDNDVLVSINGQSIENLTFKEIAKLSEKKKAGDIFKIGIKRKNKLLIIPVKVSLLSSENLLNDYYSNWITIKRGNSSEIIEFNRNTKFEIPSTAIVYGKC